jgi:hypothetical protein
MRYIVLAILLAVVQAAPTVPRKASNDPTRTSSDINDGNTSDQRETRPAPAALKTDSNSPKSNGREPSPNADGNSIIVRQLPPVTVATPRRDWADWGTWIFNFLLVIVGALQVLLLGWTFRLVKHQAHEVTRQRVIMRGQLETMQGQLDQMKGAGEQTEKMITQVTEQVQHLKVSSGAAKQSADTLVAAERAWVQVHITKQPQVQMSSGSGIGITQLGIQRVWFWPDVINIGRTPAKMTKIFVVTCQIPKPLGTHSMMPPELPPEPIYAADNQRRAIGIEREMFLAPNMGVNPLPIEVRGQEWADITQRKVTLYVYGFIDYVDVAGNSRQTRFCEVYWIPTHAHDPNMQGFLTAGNTPAAYTRCI